MIAIHFNFQQKHEVTIMSTIKLLRVNLTLSIKSAKKWFFEASIIKTRAEYKARGGPGDEKTGAVYVYIGQGKEILYVGQTGRGIKERANYLTARHNTAEWWDEWEHIRFLPLTDETDRLTLELLLILELKPRENKKPKYRKISDMFKDKN